jgi:anaerobic magnesium-protoporphyrin IX monomethyl ester cyclase
MKTTDCLIIGHNEMNFSLYIENIKKMGSNSGAYRDLNLNFIQYNNTPYHAADAFNLFCCNSIEKKSTDYYRGLKRYKPFSAAIAYLGTYLRARGYTFDYINSFQDENEELRNKLRYDNILTVAITTTLYVSAFPIIEIKNFIKEHNETTKIIVGGPFISSQVRMLEPEELMHLFQSILGADFYVNSSQGEATLVQIIQALKGNLPVQKIHNIYYKTNGGYASTPTLKENNPLSENMVNWDLFPDTLGRCINVRTSRSCPFSCAFCGYPQHAGHYETASVKDIEKELTLLEKKRNVTCLSFIDDTFNVPVKRFKKILRMMKHNQYRFKWYSYFRCQYADREMVELMKETGCEGVYLGIESGNNQILKNMNKKVTIEQYLEGIAFLKEYGIITFGNFIIGFPGETGQTAKDTLTFIQQGGLDFYRVQLWYCEPITPIWQQKDKYNLKGQSFEWRHKTMDSPTAAALIDDIFFSLENHLWIPLYNFNFDGIWDLVHRGFTLQQIKHFLKGFNQGIKKKLTHPHQQEISFEAIKQMKEACRRDRYFQNKNDEVEKINLKNKYDANFDF